jgi:hypothetical protein
MTEDDQKLLRAASEAIIQFVRDRDDMVAGFTAAFLDLYQVEFREGRQTKAEVLFRLQVQRDRLAQHYARKGVKVLDSLIQAVEKAQLQPAKPPGDRQLQLRSDEHQLQHDSSETGNEPKASEANREPVHRILLKILHAISRQEIERMPQARLQETGAGKEKGTPAGASAGH